MATATKALSYEEWLRLPENDEGREECVNGVIEKMPSPKWKHATIVENLANQLRDALDRRLVHVVTTDFGLIIRRNPLTQRTPDIALFECDSMVIQDGYIHSAPQLAVEVLSPANTPGRLSKKLDDYASIGIPEVWVIDTDARTVDLYRLENGRYQSCQLPHNGVTTPVRFPSITVDFSPIW